MRLMLQELRLGLGGSYVSLVWADDEAGTLGLGSSLLKSKVSMPVSFHEDCRNPSRRDPTGQMHGERLHSSNRWRQM
jgi:hypothetical protein